MNITRVDVDHRKLRAARVAAGLTQAAAAERMGVAQQTLQGWETGYRAMAARAMLRLCRLYGVKAESLTISQEA